MLYLIYVIKEFFICRAVLFEYVYKYFFLFTFEIMLSKYESSKKNRYFTNMPK